MNRAAHLALTAAITLAAAATVTGCKTLPPPTPLAQLNPQQAHGHAVYQAQCARCHYDRQDAPLNGPALVGLFKKPSLPSGAAATDERVTSTIVHGRNNMPAMGAALGLPDDQTDLNDLLAYLHTL